MSINIIQDKLRSYKASTTIQEENAIREITQEVALAGLARAGFFKAAVFEGGTALRILYGLNRFSEDLDFSVRDPNTKFDWTLYFKGLETELSAYGYAVEIQDRSQPDKNVKSAWIKDNSIGKRLLLHTQNTGAARSIQIKLEIDIHPPGGGTIETRYIDFPVTVPISVFDLPSLFAGKLAAILCRPWSKGRDWFDFLFYIGRGTIPNLSMLERALQQSGPFEGKNLPIDTPWLIQQLTETIQNVDWPRTQKDVERFLKPTDIDLIAHWSAPFFLDRLQKMI